MAIFSVKNITHSYDSTQVLSDVSFELTDSCSLAIVAPSGGGKSTLLSIAGLLLKPQYGQVLLDGQDVWLLDDKDQAAIRRSTFGFLFQHAQLIGSLRAIDNVCAPAYFSGLNAEEKKQLRCRAESLLTEFGLKDYMQYYPFQLSGGQKRKVMTARALLMQPKILIADEPTNDLDLDSATGVIEAMFHHVKRGGILLLATHDQALAAHCDNILKI